MNSKNIPSDSERCAWYALLVAIVRGCTADEALMAMDGGWPAAFGRKNLTPEERAEAQKERDRKYRQRPEVKERHREHQRAYQRAYHQKYAQRPGVLEKQREHQRAYRKRLRDRKTEEAQKEGGAG